MKVSDLEHKILGQLRSGDNEVYFKVGDIYFEFTHKGELSSPVAVVGYENDSRGKIVVNERIFLVGEEDTKPRTYWRDERIFDFTKAQLAFARHLIDFAQHTAGVENA